MILKIFRWKSINYTVSEMYTVTTTYDLRNVHKTYSDQSNLLNADSQCKNF